MISDRDTSLHIAAENGDINLVNQLLGDGADPNVKGQNGETPLHRAAAANQPLIIERLLKSNASIDIANTNVDQPIHLAAMKGAADAVKTLIMHNKAQLASKSREARTPFFLAAMEGKINVLKVLLESGDQINQQNFYSGETALHVACRNNNAELTSFLLENNANPNIMDRNKLTPLQVCAQQFNPSLEAAITLLANPETDVNAGNPPALISLAISANQSSPTVTEFAKLLLTHGANPDLEYKGESAFEILQRQFDSDELSEDQMGFYNLLKETEGSSISLKK